MAFSASHLLSEEDEGVQGVQEEHSQNIRAQVTPGVSHTIWYNSQHWKQGEEGQSWDIWSDDFYFHC